MQVPGWESPGVHVPFGLASRPVHEPPVFRNSPGNRMESPARSRPWERAFVIQSGDSARPASLQTLRSWGRGERWTTYAHSCLATSRAYPDNRLALAPWPLRVMTSGPGLPANTGTGVFLGASDSEDQVGSGGRERSFGQISDTPGEGAGTSSSHI